MKKEQILKCLQTQLSEVDSNILLIKSEISERNRILTQYDRTKKDLLEKIKSLGNIGEIVISEHAILRYLERVDKVDMELVKKQILSESVLDLIEKLGGNNGEYPVKEGGFKIKLKNKTVVTVL